MHSNTLMLGLLGLTTAFPANKIAGIPDELADDYEQLVSIVEDPASVNATSVESTLVNSTLVDSNAVDSDTVVEKRAEEIAGIPEDLQEYETLVSLGDDSIDTSDDSTSVVDKRAVFNLQAYITSVCKPLLPYLCKTLPTAYGPSVNPDTADGFRASSALSQSAKSAVTPPNYQNSYMDQNGTSSTSNFLGYYEMQKYDPAICAKKCDGTKGCVAFDIWFERDPASNTNKYCCPTSTGVTRIKCHTWGTYTGAGTHNNYGIARNQFQVAIAGSNGYNKLVVNSTSSSSSRQASSTATSNKASASATASGATNGTAKAGSGTATTGSGITSGSGPSATGAPVSSGGSYIATTSQASVTPASATLGATFVSNSASVAAAQAKVAASSGPASIVTASIASSAPNSCATPVSLVDVEFNLNRNTDSDETVYIYGGIPQLGNWVVDNAVLMSPYAFGSQVTNWFTDANITAGTYFEYKYYQRNADWSITWPANANRMYTVPTGCNSDVVINDVWQEDT